MTNRITEHCGPQTDAALFLPARSAITWQALVAVEPRLSALLADVQRLHVPADSPDYWRRWSSVKRRMERLVGWSADCPDLRTEVAYMAAYDHLLRAMRRGGR